MKTLIICSVLVMSSSFAFAKRCMPDSTPSTYCEVEVTGTSYSECHILRSGNMFPDTYLPAYHVHPWNRVITGTTANSCDVELQDCIDLAFRQLEKYTFTNNCGDMSVGKSVEYSFKTINADGSVESETNGAMKK